MLFPLSLYIENIQEGPKYRFFVVILFPLNTPPYFKCSPMNNDQNETKLDSLDENLGSSIDIQLQGNMSSLITT